MRRMFLVEQIAERGVLLPLRSAAGGYASLHFKLRNLVLECDAMRMSF